MRLYLLSLIVIMCSCVSDDGTIKLKGSDTEVNLAVTMAETFRKENKSILVSVSGGGSGLGIASLLNGNADIANSSRAINEEELDLFRKKTIPLDSFIFAQDAIAFVVSDKLPLDSININELKKILSGEYKNWSALTTKKLPINIYGRQSNSGTYDFVRKKLKIHFSPDAKQMNGNAQILEAIKVDNSGIGYVGAGYIMKGYENGIKILTIYTDYSVATSPLDAEKIAANHYFFQRPLYQYYRANNYQKIKPFLDFEKSDMGKKIILTSGYYPVLK